MSRRGFVAAGGALITGVAGAASAGAAWADETAFQSGDEWAGEADVIVIGYGNAGIGATKAVVDAGGTAIVLEKAPREFAGGSLSCNDGNWSYVTPEALVNGSFHTMGQQLAEDINNEGPYYSDWLAENGLEWIEKQNSVGQTVIAAHSGMEIWGAADRCLSALDSVQIIYEAPAVELMRNEGGEVIGVVAEQGGERARYKARKGVVITTGTYASNPSFIQGHHYACLPYASGTSPYNTGDGMVLAARIGARAFQDLSLAVEFGQLAVRRASEELGMAVPMSALYYRGVMVNGEGKRFMPEDVDMGHNKTTEPILTIKCTNAGGKQGNYGNGYFNLPAWVVLDEEILSSGPLYLPFGWVRRTESCSWSDDNQAEVERGWILKADTIEELAAQMKSKNSMTDEDVAVDPEALRQTVDEYNTAAEAGFDPLGKSADYLIPLGSGPYYAVEVCPSIMYTNNGITVNDDIQVLDWDGNPVPRLYAAGDVASRERACRICMPGNMVTGAHAGRNAMALDDWE